MTRQRPRCIVLLLLAAALVFGAAAPAMGQSGEMVMAWHVTLSPTWFDPSTAPPQITPFGMLSAQAAPIMDFRALMGVGPKVTEHTITWIHNSPFPSYEDVRIK